jgi:hypothetical protein
MSRTLRAVVTLSIGAALLGVQTASSGASASAPAKRAVLEGRLGWAGGPAPSGFHPTSGTVRIGYANPPIVVVHKVGKSGHFKFTLSAGTYTVTGCGPSSSGGTSPQCSKPKTIKLRSGEVDHIKLVWAAPA